MSKQECAAPRCTGKADDSGRCWKHRPRPPLSRHTRLNPVNRKRRAAKHAERFGPQAALCRRTPCFACGERLGSPHHWPTVARGGTDRDTTPVCDPCHTTGGRPRAFHSTPLAEWEAHHGVSIEAEKQRMRALVAAHKEGAPLRLPLLREGILKTPNQAERGRVWQRYGNLLCIGGGSEREWAVQLTRACSVPSHRGG